MYGYGWGWAVSSPAPCDARAAAAAYASQDARSGTGWLAVSGPLTVATYLTVRARPTSARQPP